ncbi:MAG: right-handed parallel beta-helix repeat-containing protein [Deltaproteobacteria bacterium]|nr:right-handed parallel beta-helix repeat-containing protein [Deltaproteobacteria bacterium]
MMRAQWLIALLALPTACGGEESQAAPHQPPPCDEHELGLPDGSCIRPGVPPDGCGEGFVHDGEYGCEPLLPAEPCPAGLMAVPGDETCRSIMECGDGKWGDLPVDDTTLYVDGSYAGGDGNGSESQPWATIGAALATAAPGRLIVVAAGSYNESLRIEDKAVRLWGRCPEQVAIEATGQSVGPCPPTALCILGGADGTEVGGLALRGPGQGIVLTGSEGVLVDRVRVHDNGSRGIGVESTLGPTSIHVRGSLIEQNHDIGLAVSGSDAIVDATVVRATLPHPSSGSGGIGINVELACHNTSTGLQCDPTARASANVTHSLIEQNHEVGIFAVGADVTVDATVVRATLPRLSDQMGGMGIEIQAWCTHTPTGVLCDPAARASASVTHSLIEQNHEVGLFVVGSDAIIDATVVRDTLPRVSDQAHGVGVNIQLGCSDATIGMQCDPTAPANATVVRSLIEESYDFGLFVHGSNATVDRSVVRATLHSVANQRGGLGIHVQLACFYTPTGLQCDPAARSTANVTHSLAEQNHEFGLSVFGSDATVYGSVVRATSPRGSNHSFGDGVALRCAPRPHGTGLGSCCERAHRGQHPGRPGELRRFGHPCRHPHPMCRLRALRRALRRPRFRARRRRRQSVRMPHRRWTVQDGERRTRAA